MKEGRKDERVLEQETPHDSGPVAFPSKEARQRWSLFWETCAAEQRQTCEIQAAAGLNQRRLVS